jgi:Ca2+-transporting ATPase
LAAVVSFLLQMVVVYAPFCQVIFKTESLTAFDWLLVVALSSLPLWAMEIIKAIKKRPTGLTMLLS